MLIEWFHMPKFCVLYDSFYVTTYRFKGLKTTINIIHLRRFSSLKVNPIVYELNDQPFVFQINQLLEEVQRLQGCISSIKESSLSQIARLEEQLDQKRQHIVRLETKLEAQKDYEEVKRQVAILKSDLVNNPQCKDIELLLEKTKIQVQEQRDKSPSRDSDGMIYFVCSRHYL